MICYKFEGLSHAEFSHLLLGFLEFFELANHDTENVFQIVRALVQKHSCPHELFFQHLVVIDEEVYNTTKVRWKILYSARIFARRRIHRLPLAGCLLPERLDKIILDHRFDIHEWLGVNLGLVYLGYVFSVIHIFGLVQVKIY